MRKCLLKFVSLTLISVQEGMEAPKKNVALVGSKKTAEVRLHIIGPEETDRRLTSVCI